MENKNKIALVTGGSRGLGKDMALKLAAKGLDVLLTYHSNAGEADKVIKQIQQSGRKAAALKLDAGDTKSFSTFKTQLTATLKGSFDTDKFDFLVNNGGIGLYAPIVETTEEAYLAHGLDKMSQDDSIAFCENVFSEVLEGASLMTNARHMRGSAWLNFQRLI